MARLVKASERSALIRLAHSMPAGAKRKALLREIAKIAKINLRPFKKTDWFGFSGAEPFSDGSEPFIGDFENLPTNPLNDPSYSMGMIIVDKNGIQVIYSDENANEVIFATDTGIDDPIQARRVAEQVLKMVERGKLPQGMRKVYDGR